MKVSDILTSILEEREDNHYYMYYSVGGNLSKSAIKKEPINIPRADVSEDDPLSFFIKKIPEMNAVESIDSISNSLQFYVKGDKSKSSDDLGKNSIFITLSVNKEKTPQQTPEPNQQPQSTEQQTQQQPQESGIKITMRFENKEDEVLDISNLDVINNKFKTYLNSI